MEKIGVYVFKWYIRIKVAKLCFWIKDFMVVMIGRVRLIIEIFYVFLLLIYVDIWFFKY